MRQHLARIRSGVERRLPRYPRHAAASVAMQWVWLLPGVDDDRTGRHRGPRTWLTERRHQRLDRPMSISLLEYPRSVRDFGQLTAWWINERSQLFRAEVNRGVETADVVWVFSQDPLTNEARGAVTTALGRARPDAVVLNHPDHYNAYHEDGCFARLAAAGVSVPRTTFDDSDLGRTPVVYKRQGEQGSEKYLEPYDGPRPGFRAFEFVDAADASGLRARFRTFYIAGVIRPSKVLVSDHWNVCLEHARRMEYSFSPRPEEEAQIRLIAETLGLDYFAVDYLRCGGFGEAVFVDINVYPVPISLTPTNRLLGHYGRWHTFDTRMRLGLPEPMDAPLPTLFDEAMRSLVADR